MHSPGRRQLLVATAALLAVPAGARAQSHGAGMPRIGYLSGRSLDFESRWLAAFRQGLDELGYREGQDIRIEERHADARMERLPGLAAELVRLNVGVLVAAESFSAVAAKQATRTIPIVSLSQDPVALGLVESIARPGGNVTGLSDYHADMANKRLELLREIVPAASRFAVFFNPDIRPNHLQLQDLQRAASSLRLGLQPFELRTRDDVETAFAAMARRRADGLILLPGGVVSSNQRRIAELALAAKLPAIYTVRVWAELGGLISYGTDFAAYYRRAATYVDRILKGATPAQLPIEQATTFELVVNLRTAKALGIAMPPAILLRANHVLE